MKKSTRFILLFIVLIAAYAGWSIFGPTVSEPAGKYFFIHTGETYADVKADLTEQHILSGSFIFDKVAAILKYKDHVKPGRYEIKGGSIFSLVRMLKAGNQSPVKLVINKLRTKEDLASKISRNFECDSAQVMHFLTSTDSLAAYHLDSNTVMTTVIPNTYQMLWNSPFSKIFGKLKDAEEIFWNETRTKKAAAKNLTPQQVYILASIVEEETNKPEDKGLIASVYLNRYTAGQKLQADPTVKYAMRNFALKRIYDNNLKFESPYNTYINTGFPPGPICTPSTKTLDAVLDAPATNYMYFVAKPELNGYSNFAATYAEHLVFAKAYQKALDSLALSKQTGTGK
jgi:UPF0755 protein